MSQPTHLVLVAGTVHRAVPHAGGWELVERVDDLDGCAHVRWVPAAEVQVVRWDAPPVREALRQAA